MKILELIRLEEDCIFGTFGILKIDKNVFCVTLEPKDELNEVSKSSIPAQQYVCVRHKSNRYKNTWRVKDVPGRSGILFHKGNVAEDTAGCILLAQYFGKLRGNRAVLNSGNTFAKFMEITKEESVLHLTIKEVY